MKNKQPIILSTIILNYNSGDYLLKSTQSLYKSKLKDFIEIIVVDNASTDRSFQQLFKFKNNLSHPKIKLKFLALNKNLGFSTGNNRGLKKINSKSKYVLFLNPDTTVNPNTIQQSINFHQKNPQVDASTCKIILAKTNQTQPECHRGFPTPWRSFCYFSGLSKLFPKSKLFSGYFLGHLNRNKVHQIEACVGAFLMVKKSIGQKINWWNQKYFFYGEDLDFCFQLKKHNFKLYYNPNCQITHYQGISSGIKQQSKKLSQASRQTKIRSAKASTQAMRIFYQLNYFDNYSNLTKFIVNQAINLLEKYRVFKAKYL
ncbi:hypothetical protein DRH14_01375 [Candidatus Shapirobacteria bacterium]|nr:MAG: hypothetical protein DRH14_01375 [Candidatus Shapirobacteria bacterium]